MAMPSTSLTADDKAINDWTAAIKKHPKVIENYLHRGAAYERRGQLQNAIYDFSQVIKLSPGDPTVLEARGFAYLKLGMQEKGLADFNESVKRYPDNYFRHIVRASAYERLKQNEKAIEDYNLAIKLAPEQPFLYDSRAKANMRLKNFAKALEDCNKAISMVPHNRLKNQYGDLFVHRSWVYRDMHKLPEALADCDTAISFEPDELSKIPPRITDRDSAWNECFLKLSTARSTRGMIYAEQHELDKALQDLNMAIKFTPKRAICYSARGKLYRDLGMPQKASDDFASAKRLKSAEEV